jgi:hypothetical protein
MVKCSPFTTIIYGKSALLYDKLTKRFSIEASSIPDFNSISRYICIIVDKNKHSKIFEYTGCVEDKSDAKYSTPEVCSWLFHTLDGTDFSLEIWND